MVAVLFVCLGNICRSPAAEGVLRHMAAKDARFSELRVESCGMGAWHLGHLPDERMRDAAKIRGVALASRARQFKPDFFDQYDYILASDKEVLNQLFYHAQDANQKSKIHLMTNFSSLYKGQEIPDPYYHGSSAFDLVLDMLEDSCEGLLNHIVKKQKA